MRPVSDDFLLNVAEVSATLIGLFLVGVFFYVETGFRRLGREREALEPYIRSSTRIVFLLIAIPLALSLTLVSLELPWSRVLFVLLSVLLVAANVDTILRVLPVARATRSTVLLVNEALGSALVVILVLVPWILGGLHPTREDLTWAILLSLAGGPPQHRRVDDVRLRRGRVREQRLGSQSASAGVSTYACTVWRNSAPSDPSIAR
jgi:hypothetical protein